MNENIDPLHQIAAQWPILKHLGMLATVGVVVGLGTALAEMPKLPTRVVFGRALTSAGMGVAAGGVLSWMPDMPLIAQCAVAAGMASLGTSGVTAMLQRVFTKS